MDNSFQGSGPSTDMSAFKEVLRNSKHIIAVTGAGLSAASGIPTFRGAGGLWRQYKATKLATLDAFMGDPSLVWQFYHYRRETALSARPNVAHTALSLLSVPAIRNQIAHPDGTTFHHITQNVDCLASRSLRSVYKAHGLSGSPEPGAETSSLIEMHGRIFDVLCNSCGHVEFNTTSPICPALGGTEAAIGAIASDSPSSPPVSRDNLPRCIQCASLARPGVVWFGEIPKHLDIIDELVDAADLCLVVGTRSTVYPAAGYAYAVKENGGKVAVFNLERTNGDEDADFLFLGACEETLIEALGMAPYIAAMKPSDLN